MMFEHKVTNVRGPVSLGTTTVHPVPPKRGVVKIVYNGLLVNSGAQDIYMRTGYGNSDHWQDVYDYKMSKGTEGWEQILHLNRSNYLQFCFKDGAGHWDNNNGQNWNIDTEGF